MASRTSQLFGKSKEAPVLAPKQNYEGGPAWDRPLKERIAEVLTLGVLGNTYYAKAEDLRDEMVAVLREGVRKDPWFVAKAAAYARNKGLVRMGPIVALTVLSCAPQSDRAPFYAAFGHVVRTLDDLRNFVVLCKGGKIRKTFGGCAKIAARQWLLANVDEYAAMKYNTGADWTLRDLLRVTKPNTENDPIHSAVFGWAVGKDYNRALAPRLAVLDRLSAGTLDPLAAITEGNLPFETVWHRVPHTPEIAAAMVRQAPYMNLLRSLNAYAEAGAFQVPGIADYVASTLADEGRVRTGKQFPFRYYEASSALSPDVPAKVRNAITDALDLSVGNLPRLPERTVISPDVSGSMGAPVGKHTTAAIIAGIFSAALWKSQDEALVLPFGNNAAPLAGANARDSVMSIANAIPQMSYKACGGGTDIGAPMRWLKTAQKPIDLFIGLTDSEDWAGRGFLTEWREYTRRFAPNAKAVLIQLLPYGHSVAPKDEPGVYYVFGWSPSVVSYVAKVASGDDTQISEIERLAL